MWVRLSILQKGLVLIAVPLLFQLAFIALLADMQHGNAEAAAWSIHSKEVLQQTHIVLHKMLEMGTGLRGSILANDPDLHAAYEKAAAELPAELRKLRDLVGDNADQSARADEIEAATDEFMKWHAGTVAASKAGRRDEAIARTKSETGTQLYGRLYNALMDFVQAESKLDGDRTRDLEQSRQRQRWLLVAGSVASFLLTVAVAFVFSRSISGRLNGLTDNVRRLAEGKSLGTPLEGRDEVAMLDRAFRAMADEITRSAQSLRGSADEIRALYDQARRSEQEIRRLNEGLERGIAERTADLARANAALREADRRKDEFLAMLAHELRNPLAPMRNTLHVLRQPGVGADAVRQSLDVMGRQLRHLTRLIDDLLDVSRITRGKITLHRERLDLVRLVRQAVEDRREAVTARGVRLELGLPDTPVWVTGDVTRLAQVVDNLLENAAKFTGEGGRVTVAVRAEPGRGDAAVTVRDTGIGIEPDLLPRLFQPFAQGDRSLDRGRGGLGLGLSIVKGLAELHGGSVEAASAGPGRGAEFTVRLPLAAEPAALAEKPVAPRPPPQRRRVLVVEDNRDSAESLRMLLEVMGYEVAVANSGPEGVAAAARGRPDVVLCDIGLPGMDGFAVASALRGNPATAAARLIAVTGYGQEDDRRRALAAGFHQHLVKPVDPERLLAELEPAAG